MPELEVEFAGRVRTLTSAILVEDYACVAAAVIVFYDYVLTFDLEVQRIWKRSFGFPEAIFLANRCLAIALSLPLVVSSQSGTRTGFTLQIIFGNSLGVVIALFFALRTYAIWNSNRIVFVSVVLAYIPAFTLNLRMMLLNDISDTSGIIVSMLVPCCFVAFDLLVLILTVLPLRRMYGSSATGTGTLTEFLLAYGVLYVSLLLLTNLGQLLFTTLTHESANANVLLLLSSTLVSRFMLHLREPQDPRMQETLKDDGQDQLEHRMRRNDNALRQPYALC